MPMPAYVNSGAETAAASHVPTDGINVTFPAALVAGNLLVIQSSIAGGANGFLGDDIYDATSANHSWALAYNDGPPTTYTGIGYRQFIWWKFCTGGETGSVKINVTSASTAGGASFQMRGAIHQFSNVLNPGTATFFEAAKVTFISSSGSPEDEDITTSGTDRLAINCIITTQTSPTQVTSQMTGEAGGDWQARFWTATAAAGRPFWLQTADMAAIGTVGGGRFPGTWSPNAVGKAVRGWAFAPCGDAAVLSKVPLMMHRYMMLQNEA